MSRFLSSALAVLSVLLLLFSPEAHLSGRTRHVSFKDVVNGARIVLKVKLPAKSVDATHTFSLPKPALQPTFDFSFRSEEYEIVAVLKGEFHDVKGHPKKKVRVLSSSGQRSLKYERKVALDGARRRMFYDQCADFDVEVRGNEALLLLSGASDVPHVYEAVIGEGILPLSRLNEVVRKADSATDAKPLKTPPTSSLLKKVTTPPRGRAR